MAESFFEFREKLTSPKRQAAGGSGAPSRETLTVTQLTRKIETALRQGLAPSFLVRGEVSNFNRHAASGHFYFTLKDQSTCIDCVMFRDDAQTVKFTPKDGMELLATGGVKVYAQRGKYQLYVTSLEPLGQGALELAFQQMRQKLEREGLFAQSRKKPLPEYPMRVALVTAAGGAALQDILKVLRRSRWLKLFLYPVSVQGDGAAPQIAAALTHLSRRSAGIGGIDLILLGRGGGSLEDLWAFNEEVVARAIATSKIPIVTGIGHEVDVSIADLVADYHAHTPTEAAQVITTHWRVVGRTIDQTRFRLARALRDQATSCRHRLDGVHRHEFFRRPLDLVNVQRERLDDRQQAMRVAINAQVRELQRDLREMQQTLVAHHPRHAIDVARLRVDALGRRLHAGLVTLSQKRAAQVDSLDRALRLASPESVLRRGFSLTTLKKDGSVVRSADQITGGERLVTRLANGQIESTADDPKQPKLFYNAKRMKIVLNADDFGYDADTLRATIDCFEQGALTSASIMANMPETLAAVEYAKSHPQFGFGVHLTYVCTGTERALSDPKTIPALCDEEGTFFPYSIIRLRASRWQIPADQIERETIAEIAFVRDHGVRITHVDSHQHVHKFGCFLSVLEKVLPRFGIRHLRTVQDTYLKPKLTSPIYWLGGLWHRRIAKHFSTTDHFYMATCRQDMQRMDQLVPKLKGESIEVGVHPGYAEPWRNDERTGAIAFAAKAKAVGHQLITWNEI